MQNDQAQKTTMSNLQKFLNEYGIFMSENPTVNFDVDVVLRDIACNIIDPQTSNKQVNELYQKGKNLKRDIAAQILPRIKMLKEDKIYELVLSIEELNAELNREYDEEINRGIASGIYHRGNGK